MNTLEKDIFLIKCKCCGNSIINAIQSNEDLYHKECFDKMNKICENHLDFNIENRLKLSIENAEFKIYQELLSYLETKNPTLQQIKEHIKNLTN